MSRAIRRPFINCNISSVSPPSFTPNQPQHLLLAVIYIYRRRRDPVETCNTSHPQRRSLFHGVHAACCTRISSSRVSQSLLCLENYRVCVCLCATIVPFYYCIVIMSSYSSFRPNGNDLLTVNSYLERTVHQYPPYHDSFYVPAPANNGVAISSSSVNPAGAVPVHQQANDYFTSVAAVAAAGSAPTYYPTQHEVNYWTHHHQQQQQQQQHQQQQAEHQSETSTSPLTKDKSDGTVNIEKSFSFDARENSLTVQRFFALRYRHQSTRHRSQYDLSYIFCIYSHGRRIGSGQ